jgi:NIPSNAP
MTRAAEQPPLPVLDVRTYKLEPGAGEEFDRLVREHALPMLHRFGIDVVGSGPSLDDRDLYCLLRAFPSAARRDAQLGSFYGSDEWRQNYRDTALALIEAYHTVTIPLTLIGQRLGRRT